MRPSQIRGDDAGAHKENGPSREPPRDKTDSKAKKRAKLTLKLRELEVKERRLKIEREMMDLDEED